MMVGSERARLRLRIGVRRFSSAGGVRGSCVTQKSTRDALLVISYGSKGSDEAMMLIIGDVEELFMFGAASAARI
jgi:hypothetical protein